MFYRTSMHGLSFDHEVKKAVVEEASRLLAMIAGGVASVGEIRTHAIDGKLLNHLQGMKESPDWMKDGGFQVNDAKVDE